MMSKKRFVHLIILVIMFTLMVSAGKLKKEKGLREVTSEISVERGNIKISMSTTGIVEPQNRLEIMPPIGGRIEEILVKEGQTVKAGEVMAWMSSTERAALLDAARAQGEESSRYWEEVYKPTPLIAPLDGEVIVRPVEPGQTVSSTTPVLVLSDRLIIKAQVDETDIGKVKLGQSSIISLDAYPEEEVTGMVGHVAYESKVVSNVTIYEVDIVPRTVPAVFRSGMSANVEIIEESRESVLLIPLSAVEEEGEEDFVLLKQGIGRKPQRRKVELGLTDEESIEVLSGLKEGDKILIVTRSYASSEEKREGGNPFSPWARQRRRR